MTAAEWVGCVAVLRGDGSNLRCRSAGTVPTHQGLMCGTHARQVLPPAGDARPVRRVPARVVEQ